MNNLALNTKHYGVYVDWGRGEELMASYEDKDLAEKCAADYRWQFEEGYEHSAPVIKELVTSKINSRDYLMGFSERGQKRLIRCLIRYLIKPPTALNDEELLGYLNQFQLMWTDRGYLDCELPANKTTLKKQMSLFFDEEDFVWGEYTSEEMQDI